MLSSKRMVRRVVDVRRTDTGDAGERNTTTACEGQSASSAVRTPEDTSLEGSAHRSENAILQNVKQRIAELRVMSSTVSTQFPGVSLAQLLTSKRLRRSIPQCPIPPSV